MLQTSTGQLGSLTTTRQNQTHASEPDTGVARTAAKDSKPDIGVARNASKGSETGSKGS